MAGPLNPSEKTAAERDYEKKFRSGEAKDTNDPDNLKSQEKEGDTSWQSQKDSLRSKRHGSTKKGRLQNIRSALSRPGKLKKGSAFAFILGFIVAGVWYTSILAPNILLVNLKEIYTNDLADSTTALDIYSQIMFTYKIGPLAGQDCKRESKPSEQPITCKLTTMSRTQMQAFENQGWVVFAERVYDDKKDDRDKSNDAKEESRFIVRALLPPRYKETIQRVIEAGTGSLDDILKGRVGIQDFADSLSSSLEGNDDLAGKTSSILDDASKNLGKLLQIPNSSATPEQLLNEILSLAPITSGPQLWLYSQLSTTTKQQVWGVFNPRSSFFHDARFRERIQSRYNMNKGDLVSGSDRCRVNSSFDAAINRADEGIDQFTGQVNPTNGISLSSLSGGVASIYSGLASVGCDVQSAITEPLETSALLSRFTQPDFGSQSFLEGRLGTESTRASISGFDSYKQANELSSGIGSLFSSATGQSADKIPTIVNDVQKVINQIKNLYVPKNESELINKLPFVLDLQLAGNLLATNTYSYTELVCSWYTIGNMATNALVRAKASTAARFALQYLKAADAVKSGQSESTPTNVLSGKLAQDTWSLSLGDRVGYGGGRSATDSLIYSMIAHGSIVPNGVLPSGNLSDVANQLSSLEGVGSFLNGLVGATADTTSRILYNLSSYESSLTMTPAWLQVEIAAAGLQGQTGAPGLLLRPPLALGGADSEYCKSGETATNKISVKGVNSKTTPCLPAIEAMTPPGLQVALSEVAELARRTCPPPNPEDDNPQKIINGEWRGPVQNVMLPSQKLMQVSMTPYVAAWFGINAMISASITQALYTSSATGLDANYAIFSGMGELLGDMAMSRGLVPSDPGSMLGYLALGELLSSRSGYDDIAKAKGRENPLDPYNKFSFVGSLLRSSMPRPNEGTPLLGTINNVFGLLESGARRAITPSSANAFYLSQPNLVTTEGLVQRQLAYALRLSSALCPLDFQVLAIGVFPDIMCNIRYSMPMTDIVDALNLRGVVDKMTQPNENMYKAQIDELNERIATADAVEPGNLVNLTAQRAVVETVSKQGFIDGKTGKAIPGSEYDKYLTYCVNRLDPWGRSAVGVRYQDLPDDEKERRQQNKDADGEAISNNAPGSPYQRIIGSFPPQMAVTATKSDREWYTGQKCGVLGLGEEMIKYFRIYTMLCSVDGTMSGIVDCTERDDSGNAYTNPFYLNNDILFTSWY